MAHHTIHAALLSDGRINVAQPLENPLEVEPDDTVEWEFLNAEGQAIPNALIEFRGFLPVSPTAPIMGPPKHPFTILQSTQLKTGPFTVGDEDRGLYFYVIILGGQVLNWAVPLFIAGSFSSFFGGIIIRDPQGRSRS
jgi:hypothetical protein